MKFASILVLAAAFASPAIAGAPTPLKTLEAVAQRAPDDGGAQIELAAAYQRAGRTADANTAFRRAMALDNAMLDTPTGDSVWSHEVARRALSRSITLTAR